MAKKAKEVSVPEQLEEVSRMTKAQLEAVAYEDDSRPGIIRQFAEAILDGDISDTLKIIKEVSKMDSPEEASEQVSIEDLAVGDDDEAFYKSLIQQNVAQLMRKGISPQEAARLTQNLDIFRTKLREVRSMKPKAGTILEKVLAAANAPKPDEKPTKTAKKQARTSPKRAGATKAKKTGVTSSRKRKNAKKD